jgi:hypothetical protein
MIGARLLNWAREIGVYRARFEAAIGGVRRKRWGYLAGGGLVLGCVLVVARWSDVVQTRLCDLVIEKDVSIMVLL